MTDIKIIERVYSAFAARDLDTILGLMDPEVTVTQQAPLPWGGVYHGVTGVGEFLGKLLAHLEPQVVVEEMYNSGDHVVQLGRTTGRVLANDKKFDAREIHIWGLRAERIISYQVYVDVPAILDALS